VDLFINFFWKHYYYDYDYEIEAQPYYYWWTHTYCNKTVVPQAPVVSTIIWKEDTLLLAIYVQPIIQHYESTTVKKTSATTMKIMANFYYEWKPSNVYYKIDTFMFSKVEWDIKEGTGKFMMKSALHKQQHGKNAPLSWRDVKQWKNPITWNIVELR